MEVIKTKILHEKLQMQSTTVYGQKSKYRTTYTILFLPKQKVCRHKAQGYFYTLVGKKEINFVCPWKNTL